MVPSSTSPPSVSRSGPLKLLFLNHADAWITTLAIATAALILHDDLSPRNILLALAIAVGYWLAFAINDYFDVDVDRLDEHKRQQNFFVVYPLSKSMLALGFGVIFLIFAPVFLLRGWRGLTVVVISLVMMWGYSAPPLRLKNRPGWDILAHAFFVQTFPYAATLFLIGADWLPLDQTLLILGLLTSATAQIEQQIRDAAQDARFGQTFVLAIGPDRALILLKLLTAVMLLYGVGHILLGTIPLLIAPLGLMTIPAVIPRFWRQVNEPRPERLIRLLLPLGFAYILFLLLYLLIFA